MLVNAAQEQQEMIKEQHGIIKQQQESINAKEERIVQLEARLNKIEALLFNTDHKTSETVNGQTISLTDAKLYTNQPNPFSKNTTIGYFIPEKIEKAALHISDASGTIIKMIPVDARGEGRTVLEAQALSAGTYFYTLVLDGQILETKQMVLTK